MTEDTTLDRGQLRFGLWVLFAWLLAGVTLEALHGFKIGWYLDADQHTRRLLLRLGHAHGTLLGVLNALGAFVLPRVDPARRVLPGRLLRVAALALPTGFLLGGLFPEGGDPGLGIALVPVGALALVLGVGLLARAA